MYEFRTVQKLESRQENAVQKCVWNPISKNAFKNYHSLTKICVGTAENEQSEILKVDQLWYLVHVRTERLVRPPPAARPRRRGGWPQRVSGARAGARAGPAAGWRGSRTPEGATASDHPGLTCRVCATGSPSAS